MTRARIILAGALVTIVALIVIALPRRAIHVDGEWRPDHPVVAGAFHVHTTRSDGQKSIDEIAADAALAGLRFVVFTDHGDGTAPPEPPSYRSSVLCIDGVEISTTGGHYAVVGMAQAPYPLAGDPRDVIDDVHRLSGFGIVAHGDSPKSDLRWTDWDAPIDGLEWLNLDSVWRAARPVAVTRALLGYWLRAPESIASLADRPDSMLQQWDALNRSRPIVGIAATDSHGRIPSYEASFRTLSTHVELPRPLDGNATSDARLIVGALKGGHHFTVLEALAAPAAFSFNANADGTVAARVAALPGARLVVFRNGTVWRETRDDHLLEPADGEASVYRAEVQLASAPGQPSMPWIVSNAIHVGPRDSAPVANVPEPAGVDTIDLLDDIHSPAWTIEHDPSSSGAIARHPPGSLDFQYALGPGKPFAQVVALVRPVTDEIAHYERVVIRARADHALRVALQLRARGVDNPPRWQRSIYLDQSPREIGVRFAELRPLAGMNANAAGPVPRDSVGAFMLVIDSNNTKPGTGGVITLSEIAYVR